MESIPLAAVDWEADIHDPETCIEMERHEIVIGQEW